MDKQFRYKLGLGYVGFMSIFWMLLLLSSFLWPLWGPAVGWSYQSDTIKWFAVISLLCFIVSTVGFFCLLLDNKND